MSVRYTYAIISNGKVENTIDCLEGFEMANMIARAGWGDEAFAVDICQYRTQIGDLYHDNSFWRVDEEGNEVEIPYVPTDSQKIAVLEAANANLTAENASLQEELTNTQLATVEVYEMLLATTEGGTE